MREWDEKIGLIYECASFWQSYAEVWEDTVSRRMEKPCQKPHGQPQKLQNARVSRGMIIKTDDVSQIYFILLREKEFLKIKEKSCIDFQIITMYAVLNFFMCGWGTLIRFCSFIKNMPSVLTKREINL